MDVKDLLDLPKISNNKSGIYAIINIVNNKLYIGSAVKLSRRRINHFNLLNRNKHNNTHLQHSFNLYGKNNFVSVVLEYISDITKLIEREQVWIDQFDFKKDLYNACKIAGSQLGMKMSDEAKEKIRVSSTGRKLSDEAKLKISLTHKGKKKSKEHVEKMKLSRKGIKRTQEAIHKSNIGHYKPIYMLDINTNEIIKKFNSFKEAKEYLNVSTTSSISQAIKGKRRQAFGYKWEYV